MCQPDKGAAVPKFGEWDENNPASADGFTHIFNKVREEKAGKVPGTPPEPSYYTSRKPAGGDSAKVCHYDSLPVFFFSSNLSFLSSHFVFHSLCTELLLSMEQKMRCWSEFVSNYKVFGPVNIFERLSLSMRSTFYKVLHSIYLGMCAI